MIRIDEPSDDDTLVSYDVPESCVGLRLDRALSTLTGCSRALAGSTIDNGQVGIDGKLATSRSTKLSSANVITFPATLLEGVEDIPIEADGSVDFDVIYADEDIIVIDKPANLVVHPGVGNPSGTLASGLLFRYPEIVGIGSPLRPGIVHRLDRPTTGLMVVARSALAYDLLVGQLSNHSVERRYLALVHGVILPPSALLEGPIGKSTRGFGIMSVSAQGKWARTHYSRLAILSLGDEIYSLVDCSLETGRTHQIRVHLSSHGFPIVGDVVYGSKYDFGPRVFLHAYELSFLHPRTNEEVRFSAPAPLDLQELISQMTIVEGTIDYFN
ncbi:MULTISPECIES: RluA family pseudouridine synthase [Acidithrix]|uniref:RluA family pseudouridine synthase n=1 Tax=Acidithrix TaxID=1609233 RepID=UPI001F418746|nr:MULTISPECIES: RluA family pseudouridine synthase [Acidithrix]